MHCTGPYGCSPCFHRDLKYQRSADVKQADVYSGKLLIVLPGLQHVSWFCKCKLFLSYTPHNFFLEILLKATMPRDRVRWTCLYYTFFLSLLPPSPHTRQLVWSLGDLRLSQLEHQSSHRSGPWLLCSGYFLFVPRTRPLITFSYILPSSLSLHLMSFLSFLFCPWQFVLSISSSSYALSPLFLLTFL